MHSARSICLTRLLLSALAQSLISLSMAPRSRMLSSKVLTNSLSVFKPYTSATNDSLPTKICAAVTPLSTAGVSLNTVSVATGSLRRLTLQAGNLDRQCCLRVSETLPRANWVVTSNVFLRVSAGAQPNKGRSNSKFALCSTVVSETVYVLLTSSGWRVSRRSSTISSKSRNVHASKNSSSPSISVCVATVRCRYSPHSLKGLSWSMKSRVGSWKSSISSMTLS